jgi:SAM-dependent methyltransferase
MSESLACPLCRAPAIDWISKHGHSIRECTACAHRFHIPTTTHDHVAQQYGDDYFSGAAHGYEDYLSEESIHRASAAYYVRKLGRWTEPQKHLDVGAACGFFVHEFARGGWDSVGLEPNDRMCQIAEKKFSATMLRGDIASTDIHGDFRLVSMIQVISHLLDPLDAIRRVRRVLQPGGFFLVETWDRKSWAARAFGSNWHEYNPPSVLHWFSRGSLRQSVEQQGFRMLAAGIPRKKISVGRGLSMLRHSSRDSTIGRLATAPLAMVPRALTVPYFLGDAFWMLFQRTDEATRQFG